MPQQIHVRRPPTPWGYVGQLFATSGWSSIPWLHRITAPTLVLTGGADPIARIPNATVHVVPGAGNLLLMDHAADCAGLISRFLHDEPTSP